MALGNQALGRIQPEPVGNAFPDVFRKFGKVEPAADFIQAVVNLAVIASVNGEAEGCDVCVHII